MIEIVIASNNLHKIKEYEDMLSEYKGKIKFYSLKDEGIKSDPSEDGTSYIENALIKAKSIVDKTDKYILADDSGVEFEALGEHFPGIHTHRYAIENGGNINLNPKLAKEIPNTKGTFYCAIALITPKKEIKTFLGEVNGKVSPIVEGEHGFGYDPIFITENMEHPNAYYSEEIKNSISHRRKALDKVVNYLKEEGIL